MTTEFARLANGSRIRFSGIGTINRNGAQVFIHGHDGGLLAAPKFESEDDAELEIVSLNEQLDAYETAASAETRTTPPRRRIH